MKRQAATAGLVLIAAMTMGAKGCGGKDTAAYPAGGVISGMLEAVGGPAGIAPRPLPGQVSAMGGGHAYHVAVGQNGDYAMNVPAGTYTITGHSPLYQSGALSCQAQGPVAVRSSTQTSADVYCQER